MTPHSFHNFTFYIFRIREYAAKVKNKGKNYADYCFCDVENRISDGKKTTWYDLSENVLYQ